LIIMWIQIRIDKRGWGSIVERVTHYHPFH
jgi:hypothetical protein